MEVQMSHSQMLTARRRKQKTRKRLAAAAKREKKLGKENVSAANAEARKESGP
jgi:hypothetical protein